MKNKDFALYKSGNDMLALVCFNHRMANKINNRLGYYKGYKIKAGEEPLFLISYPEIESILSLFPLRYDKGHLKKIIENKSLK